MSDSVFVDHRPLLFAIAYEIVGTVVDAEDVLQESYLRWRDVDRASVAQPRNYLARIVARQALNHLRTIHRRRENYVGSWLPEPVATGPALTDDAGLAASVSMAMMIVLESLTPDERAVFVLHNVFGFALTEIAEITGKSDAAVRQIAHRSRAHVHARRRRFEPEPELAEQVVTNFLVAAHTGDLQSLMDLLAPDVVQISDGGGKAAAARRPITGARAVGQFCIGVARTAPALRVEFIRCNAMPAALFRDGDAVHQLLLFEIVDARIHGIYAVRNPDKLGNANHLRELLR
ncbi:RNA polymerase sigma factor SigJ [Mycobacterium sp. CPCC 205372]|uniref:RNA polymerase sigma factor SigJ n=1 Tax=Mycobacterium hippophais TaxID=3016340 RepID=A0ABT4PT11_9MYCO|nr:RNA polymerase sigma factor SigJ [Mycobacterium hippophais]MCZ8379670.1 RNA polymerase sigma factor SigJ [Mycobacterium hippophais]